MSLNVDHYSPLIRKLESFAPLGEDDKVAIRQTPGQMRLLGPREDLVREDDPPIGVSLVVDGLAYRYKLLPGGRRQILSWLAPGDLCDTRVSILRRMDHAVAAFVPTRFLVFSHEAIAALGRGRPRLRRALWWSDLVEDSIGREWLVNLGQRTAVERAAHLLCEIHHRLRRVGLAADDSFTLPVTQSELGDTLGLSTVHVNRTLQELRREGLIAQQGREIVVADPEGLRRTAGFSPNYLHPAAADEDGAGDGLWLTRSG